MEAVIEILVSIVVLAGLLVFFVPKLRTEYWVYDYQKAVLFRFGRRVGLLPPGRHTFWGKGYRVDTVDTRRTAQAVANQEIITSDGISLKVSAIVEFAITDAEKAVLTVDSYKTAIHVGVQAAVRDVIGRLTAEELLGKRMSLGPELAEKCSSNFEAFGVNLESLQIRDIMFPGELKKIFSQVAQAKQEGLASLERARGESAALRHLANAAKMLENNPDLMKLRILQSLSEAKSATVVLDTTDGKNVAVR